MQAKSVIELTSLESILAIITLEFRFYYEKRAGIFPVMPTPQGRHYGEAIYRADYDSTVFHYACPIGQA